jgi:DNA-binding transcriptional LysR family regulator
LRKKFDELKDEFLTIRANEQNVLNVGFSVGLLDTVGETFLKQYQIMNDISIIQNEEPDTICEEKLVQGLYSIGFTFAPFSSRFTTIELDSVPMTFWVNSKNPLCKADAVTVEDLAEHPLATPGRDFKSHRRILNLCAKKAVTPLSIHPSYDPKWIFEFVESNKGLGTNVGVWVDVSNLSDKNTIVTLPFENLSLTFGVSWKKSHTLTPSERLFVDQVVERFKGRQVP